MTKTVIVIVGEGPYRVLAPIESFNGPFDMEYDHFDTAEDVAHAVAATLHGLGYPTLIVGCICPGEHEHEGRRR